MGIAVLSTSPEGRKSSYKGAAQVGGWLAHTIPCKFTHIVQGLTGLPTTNSTDKLHVFLECVIVHSPAHRSPGELVSSWDMLLSLHRLLDHSVK